MQLAGNRVVPWFYLFCLHFLPPKLQVPDSLEKKSVTFFWYSGMKSM